VKTRPGSILVYAKEKVSLAPGPRARNVQPAERGDHYRYQVDKYWVVCGAGDGVVELRTARGKRHSVSEGDPHLRRLSLREWLWLHVIERRRLRDLRRQWSEAALEAGLGERG